MAERTEVAAMKLIDGGKLLEHIKERNFAMKKYIGTKLIEAAPAIRKGGKVYEKTHPIPRSMDPEEDGYKVRYPDGYESFSPKQVFEEAYQLRERCARGN